MASSPKENKYIEGLLDSDTTIIQQIYSEFSPKIETLILHNNGTSNDAKDVFQDALIIIYKKAQEPDFQLTSSFYTYLYSICKFTWLKKIRKKTNQEVTISDKMVLSIKEENQLEHILEEREKNKFLTQSIKKLGEGCQSLLALYFKKKNMQEIATHLALKNEHTARNKKYKCLKSLEKIMKTDVRFSEYTQM